MIHEQGRGLVLHQSLVQIRSRRSTARLDRRPESSLFLRRPAKTTSSVFRYLDFLHFDEAALAEHSRPEAKDEESDFVGSAVG
jgi:hypothetical protein